MEKEIQLQKIKELLLSKDDACVELAFQLMEALNMTEIFPVKFRDNGITTKENYMRGVGGESESFLREFLQMLDAFLDDMLEKSLRTSKVFYVMAELLQQFSNIQDKIPKVVFEVLYNDEQYKLSSEIIYSQQEINKVIQQVDELNRMDKLVFKEYYKDNFRMIRSQRIDFVWLDIRRKSFPNPIQYEIQPFDESYSIFKVMATIDIKKSKVK